MKPANVFELLYQYDPLKDPISKDILSFNGDGYVIYYVELNLPIVSNRDMLVLARFYKTSSEKEALYIMKGLDMSLESDRMIMTKIGKNPEDYKPNPKSSLVRAYYNRFF